MLLKAGQPLDFLPEELMFLNGSKLPLSCSAGFSAVVLELAIVMLFLADFTTLVPYGLYATYIAFQCMHAKDFL